MTLIEPYVETPDVFVFPPDVRDVCLTPVRTLHTVGPLTATATADVLATELMQAVDRGESYTFHGLRPVSGVEAEALASWLADYSERVRRAIN